MKVSITLAWIVVASILLVGCDSDQFSTPLPVSIAGTEYSDPMSVIEAFATGTAAAQTQSARMGEEGATQTAIATSGPFALTIILPDGSQYPFTYEELEGLSTHTANLFDQPRPVVDLGILLSQTALAHPAYSVTFEGLGSLTLRFDQLSDAALYLNEGTVNFFSGKILADDWPRNLVLLILH